MTSSSFYNSCLGCLGNGVTAQHSYISWQQHHTQRCLIGVSDNDDDYSKHLYVTQGKRPFGVTVLTPY